MKRKKKCFSSTFLQYTIEIYGFAVFLVYKPKHPLAGLWNVRLKTITQPKGSQGTMLFSISPSNGTGLIMYTFTSCTRSILNLSSGVNCILELDFLRFKREC